jgi:hypothetical protein
MPKHPTNPYRAPLNGVDAMTLLRITWGWIEKANDGYGSDIGDLMHELETCGYDATWIEGN